MLKKKMASSWLGRTRKRIGENLRVVLRICKGGAKEKEREEIKPGWGWRWFIVPSPSASGSRVWRASLSSRLTTSFFLMSPLSVSESCSTPCIRKMEWMAPAAREPAKADKERRKEREARQGKAVRCHVAFAFAFAFALFTYRSQ